jgi:hypothetical protein
MTEHVAFLMKDLVLLAVSFYLLREEVKEFCSLPQNRCGRIKHSSRTTLRSLTREVGSLRDKSLFGPQDFVGVFKSEVI